LDRFLTQLARRLRIPDADIVTADEVRNWPDGKLEELLAAGILQETESGTTVICDQCDERCDIEPQRRTDSQTGRIIGVHICMREGTGGRIEIDLNRLRRWKISDDKCKALGLLRKRTKRARRRSAGLSPREQEVYRLIHVEGRTQSQAAYELGCSAQNVSQVLKKAEMKLGLGKSRSPSLSKAQRLPEDKRGQVAIEAEEIEADDSE